MKFEFAPEKGLLCVRALASKMYSTRGLTRTLLFDNLFVSYLIERKFPFLRKEEYGGFANFSPQNKVHLCGHTAEYIPMIEEGSLSLPPTVELGVGVGSII